SDTRGDGSRTLLRAAPRFLRSRSSVYLVALRRPGQRQVPHRPQAGRVDELLVARLDGVVGDPAVPLARRDAELPAREVRSEAAVHSGTERNVTIRFAVEAHV